MSDMQRQLRVGVLGVGLQGAGHLHNLAADPRASIAALCDINADLLAERANAFGVERTFNDYRALLDCDDIDAVIVALPDAMHRDPSIAALDAGKHVLLEKPMALTVEDAQAVADAAGRSNRAFMLNLSNRWMPAFSKAHDLIASGDMGQVRYIFSRMSNRIDVPTKMLKWLSDSHLAHWIGVHRFDIARWLVGREVVRVRAVERDGVLKARGMNVADFYQATLEFDGGAVLSLEGSWILPESHPGLVDSKFYIVCDNGVIDIDRMRSELAVAGPSRYDASTPGAGPLVTGWSGFTVEASRHFVDCCLNGTQPLIGAADGVAMTRTLCAIVESAQSDGRIIDLAW
jgi:predicted dehydrogenase